MGCTKEASYGFPGESPLWYIQDDTCFVRDEHDIVSYLDSVLKKSRINFA